MITMWVIYFYGLKEKGKETYNIEVPVGILVFLSMGLNNDFLDIETTLVIWIWYYERLFYNNKWHYLNDLKTVSV